MLVCDSFPYISIPSFQGTNLVVAAISTRIGGVSQRPYESLNLAYHVGDDPKAVNENRIRFCKALGIDINSLVLAQQIHGDRVAVIDDPQAGFGAYNHDLAIPGTDAMITKSNAVSLAILTADCVPVLILDPVKKVVGISHAGWRGLIKEIVFKTILMMKDTFNTNPMDCLVAIGPSIGSCCYEVSKDLIDQFHEAFGMESVNNKLNLQLAAKIQLVNAGVKDENITVQEICTSCENNLLYSYRADGGATGRMMSVIRLIYA